jgi:thiol:disulfide interchange protein DsbD
METVIRLNSNVSSGISKIFYSFYILFLTAVCCLFFNINVYAEGLQHVRIKSYLAYDSANPGSEVKLAVLVNIDSTWHINSNVPHEKYLIPCKLTIDTSIGFSLSKVIYPLAENIKLSFSENLVSVYEKEIFITALIKIPAAIKLGRYKLLVKFNYQSCNNISCLAPAAAYDTVLINVVSQKTELNEINKDIFKKIAYDSTSKLSVENKNDIGSIFEKNGLLIGLLLIFIGGLTLNLTPCVYPLIPITIGYFGSQTQGSKKRLVLMGLVYVLGIAITYSVLGVVTALSGAVFGLLLQNTYVLIFIALVLILLSLSMFGIYEFKLPDFIVAKAGSGRSGIFGAFFMGLTMGIVAAPCVGPFVLGLITIIAAKGDPYFGFLIFFVLSLGLGSPYFLLAIFSTKIKNLPRAGEWMEGIKHIFGLILVGMAIYFLLPVIPKLLAHFILPVYMILSACYILFVDKNGNKIKGFISIKIIFSIIVIGIAVYLLLPSQIKSPSWEQFSKSSYSRALHENKPVIIDFYADWCIPCKELDDKTFSDSRVINASQKFLDFKADMTKSLSPEIEDLRNNFNIIGVPTIVIMDSNGKEIKRIVGFIGANEFYKIIENIK